MPFALLISYIEETSSTLRAFGPIVSGFSIGGWLAGVEGLEPPTYGFGDRRSSQLSYTPLLCGFILAVLVKFLSEPFGYNKIVTFVLILLNH